MKVRPLSDRVLIKRIEEDEQMMGGIIIPDTAKSKPLQAEVIAVGPGNLNDDGEWVAIEVKVGDRVLVGEYAGTDVEIDGETCAIIRQDDIMGILE